MLMKVVDTASTMPFHIRHAEIRFTAPREVFMPHCEEHASFVVHWTEEMAARWNQLIDDSSSKYYIPDDAQADRARWMPGNLQRARRAAHKALKRMEFYETKARIMRKLNSAASRLPPRWKDYIESQLVDMITPEYYMWRQRRIKVSRERMFQELCMEEFYERSVLEEESSSQEDGSHLEEDAPGHVPVETVEVTVANPQELSF